MAGLASSLIGSDYRVEWSDEDARPWNGKVRLVSRKTGKTLCFSVRNLVFPAGSSAGRGVWDQQFGLAEDRNSIIIAEQRSGGQSGAKDDFALSRFDVDANRTVWRLNRLSLERIAGGRIQKWWNDFPFAGNSQVGQIWGPSPFPPRAASRRQAPPHQAEKIFAGA